MKFQDGDVVLISESALEYHKEYIGKIGTIKKVFRTSDKTIMYGVMFDNLRNPRSSKGLFWFKSRSLSFNNPKNSDTNESEEIPMFENYVVAKIQFLDNPVPVYSYAMYEDIPVGTVVVVQTGSHGFALARIESIVTDPEAKSDVRKGRQVVCPVDFSAYNARKEALCRANELQTKMEAKLREVQSMAIYEMFAEKDPALKAMLNEFKSLQSEIKGVPYEQTEAETMS